MEQMSAGEFTVRPEGKSSNEIVARKHPSLSWSGQFLFVPSGKNVLHSNDRDFALLKEIFLIEIVALPPSYPMFTIDESVVQIGLRSYMVLIGFCAMRTRADSIIVERHPLLSVMRNVTS